MEGGQWNRIEDLFHQAAELAPTERGAFLNQACGEDQELRRELESLLAADIPEEDLIEAAVGQAARQFPTATDAGAAGRRIGPYQILREIGHGGMGTVYLAERADGQYRKQVAIKLVSPHLGTEEILRRFRNERQVQASLEHPNIARLLDGGATADGLPYLVMEYVEGVRIDSWCHGRKLPVPDRLKLFRQVCAAVQSAHDREIVHRDIKPGNILVTAEGTPKLLDFGIAKVLNPGLSEVAQTTIGPGPMTPEYASPEQVRGEPVGPASDIYALGVVLYQLLTGQLPYPVQGGDLLKAICEREPVAPSKASRAKQPTSLRRQLAGDLDNIVLKALRKEPERRYRSVAQLSEDVDRFLKDLPVQARKETLPYRGRKFLKRNRVATVAVAVTAVVVLVNGVQHFGKSSEGASTVKAGKLLSNGTTVLRWDNLKFEKLATLGDPAPGGGTFMKDFEPWGMNNRGDVVFVSDFPGGREGIFLLRRGAGLPTLQLARGGQPAPGGGTFDRDVAGYTSINDSGDVAFVFGLNTVAAPDLKGFAREGLFRYSQPDGKLTQIVIPGVTTVPGYGVFESIGMHPTLNKWGDLVFPGLVRTASGRLPGYPGFGTGVFLMDRNGRFTKVVAPGDPAPGGSTFDFASNPWINDLGDVAFGAHVAGEDCIPMAPCAESIYLKRAANGAIESIAHQGEQGPHANYYRYAWGPVLNNAGHLVFIGELMPPKGLPAARGIYLYSSGGVIVPIAMPGYPMPDGRTIVTVNPAGTIGNYYLNNRGDVSFNASLENGESAFYVYSQGILQLAAGTGTVVPGVGTISSVSNFLINGGTLNDSGQIFFWATLTDGKGVLLLGTPPPAAANSKR